MVARGPVDTDELWLERLESIGGDEENFENISKSSVCPPVPHDAHEVQGELSTNRSCGNGWYCQDPP